MKKKKRWSSSASKFTSSDPRYKWEGHVNVDYQGYASWGATKKAAIRDAWNLFKKLHRGHIKFNKRLRDERRGK